jgi:hypothetical protein
MNLIQTPAEKAKANRDRYEAMTLDEKIAHDKDLLDNPRVSDPVKRRVRERYRKNLGERDGFFVIGLGLCAASVCTRLTDEEATARLNREAPTGVSTEWQISKDEKFATGQPNPCPCPDYAGHRHILFNC